MSAGLRRDLAIVACALSAGSHAGLAPGHFHDGAAAGAGFVAAAVVLAALATGLTLRPAPRLAAAAALAFAGLLAVYAVAVTSGLPPVHPDPEPLTAIALATKAVEAVGLAAAASLARRTPFRTVHTEPRGT